MATLIYDGTYQGWLTAVFDIYEYKFGDVFFSKDDAPAAVLFGSTHLVKTDEVKAKRVLNGLMQRLSTDAVKSIYKTFLSEIERVEEVMWRFVKYVFAVQHNVEEDLSNNAVRDVREAAKFVHRETHRMKAFVRFKLTNDGLFYAMVEPDCNVLPLIVNHFKNRYADQRWLIYDTKRRYGIYYDLEAVNNVQLQFSEATGNSDALASILDERELFFQDMWRKYFGAVNIKARKNMRLHIQHMPKRYWKNLIEKTTGGI
ncbi:TIGR03915 family putative DNA repair protein [Mucilaginibacter auburnensis]|uniref:Putative DNA metabolism protein n=1 Tax=Mucilaginibacter auburnensis TaxID=1457233 RepID=A0A2H9VW74_9SPHI|nr:TIGR03915 family putative DNA repair protein [Mucilaginibacter auburnensis]PJJ85083.1 putative DNA metabolism protein [Mucilaginibacter auburnensis]